MKKEEENGGTVLVKALIEFCGSLTQGPDAPLRPREKTGRGTVTTSDFGGSYLPSKHSGSSLVPAFPEKEM